LPGRPNSAIDLERLGAISRVVPADVLIATATELATELASKSPVALRLAKESMNRVEFLPLKDAYRLEQDYTFRLLSFEDAGEARAAWKEKRPPKWSWR
jgi:enoyl-CoA hydratase